MSDFERYGDYNEIDEAPSKNKVLLAIKIVAIILCFSVVALILLRLWSFKYYPKEMKKIYFTEELTAYYNANGGNIKAETQKLRAPYDDAEEGNFICDHLIVVKDAGHLEITLRYNTAIKSTLEGKEYGLTSFDPERQSQFSFRLCRNGATDDDADVLNAAVTTVWDSFLMYRYCKIVFDGVDFGKSSLGGDLNWIRLEVFIDGIEKPFMIPIYEDHEDYSSFKDYEISKGELPQ